MSSPSENELHKLYPENLKLEQVQILFRHGERTPTSARFESAGLPSFWPYCSAAKQLVGITMNLDSSKWNTSQWARHLETFDSTDGPVIVSGPEGQREGICNHGELTDHGRRSTQALGARLRDLYVDRLRFLPSVINDPKMVYLRATRIPRALESLQEVFWGMYPPHFRSKDFPPPTMIMRAPTEETLTPNHGYCKRFSQLAKAFSKRAAERWNTSPDMDYVNSLIGKWMPDDRRVGIDSRPSVYGILDTINSTLAHESGTKLPNEFYDERGLAIMNRLMMEEHFSGYSESREYRALGIGSLMGDVVSRMILNVECNSKAGSSIIPLKLGLSGCHDSTLAAILTSLGWKLETWPPFTSHVSVELFKAIETPEVTARIADDISVIDAFRRSAKYNIRLLQPLEDNDVTVKGNRKYASVVRRDLNSMQPSMRSKLDGYYVRILYNDQSVTVPGCKSIGKHLHGNESFCTLEAFKTIVDKFTPLHWKQDCLRNLNAPTFPVKLEVAGI